jgi:hypothetical protein
MYVYTSIQIHTHTHTQVLQERLYLVDALGQRVNNVDASSDIIVRVSLVCIDIPQALIAIEAITAEAESSYPRQPESGSYSKTPTAAWNKTSFHAMDRNSVCELAETPRVLRWHAYELNGQRVYSSQMQITAVVTSAVEGSQVASANMHLTRIPCKEGYMFDMKELMCIPCAPNEYIVNAELGKCELCPVSMCANYHVTLIFALSVYKSLRHPHICAVSLPS